MSRSSHLDHPGSQASLLSRSASRLLCSAPGPASKHQLGADLASAVRFPPRSRRILTLSFLIHLLYLRQSLFIFLLFSLNLGLALFFPSSPSSSPHASVCSQPAPRAALKRQFPEKFPPWEKRSAFEHSSLGVSTPQWEVVL